MILIGILIGLFIFALYLAIFAVLEKAYKKANNINTYWIKKEDFKTSMKNQF